MIIPKTGKDRTKFLKFVVETCRSSHEDRMSLYARRRRYFLYGANQAGAAMHNRLNAHLDLVAAFLYSPDHAKYAVSPPDHADDPVVEQTIALSRHWNDIFRDSELAYQFSEALIWSLVYEAFFIKLGWNEAQEELYGHLVPPVHISVWDEGKPGLDNQSAFVHSYNIDHDEAVQRLFRAGLASEIPKLTRQEGRDEDDASPLLQTILMGGAWGPTITDNLTGVVNTSAEPVPSYSPQTRAPTVKWHEAYIWDDQHNDYAIFTMMEPDIVLSDSRETIEILRSAPKASKITPPSGSNIFLPGEHPFVMIQPYEMYDYFWGAAHIEKLIPLQNWSEKRLGEIQMLLARQVRPSKFGSGIMGLADETMAAMDGPGGWAFSEMPGTKLEELKPEIPPDIFAELKQINNIFLEASGLTAVLQGQGEEGVRGKSHAKQLAATGSGRIRKVAVGLEKPLAKLGDVALKLLMRNSVDRIRTATKMDFVPAQAAGEFKIRIAGHSHSPLFRDETKEDAVMMRKMNAIDNEDVIDLINPPNAAELKYKLRKRQAMQAKIAQEQAASGQAPEPGKKPNLKLVGG